MKTIREYLEMLNEPERSEAIENAEIDLNANVKDSLITIIGYSFKWGYTKQGHAYWEKIQTKLLNNTYKFENENNN